MHVAYFQPKSLQISIHNVFPSSSSSGSFSGRTEPLAVLLCNTNTGVQFDKVLAGDAECVLTRQWTFSKVLTVTTTTTTTTNKLGRSNTH